jgi:hypothetical protein
MSGATECKLKLLFEFKLRILPAHTEVTFAAFTAPSAMDTNNAEVLAQGSST